MFFKLFLKKKINESPKQFEKKFDMNNWMSLTKEERLELDFKEKNKTMKKKKALLKSIREEYFKLKNKND
tara:strand:- start:219 stop:428 length:210 start_codon:yes stop_codon:yes gene_type:complete